MSKATTRSWKQGPESDRLQKLLLAHLSALGLSPSALAELSGVSRSLCYELANSRSRTRWVSREDVGRIAWALAGRYEAVRAKESEPSRQLGIGDVEGLLTELLDAAGFSSPVDRRTADKVWNRLSRSEAGDLRGQLHVAWTPYAPLAEQGTGKPVGLAVDIVEMAAGLLGIPVAWRSVAWDDLVPAVQQGRVDCVAPFLLQLPTRLFKVRYTHSVGVLLRIQMVVHRDHAESVIRDNEIDRSQLMVACVTGEFGDTLRMTVLSGVELDQVRCRSIDEGINSVLDRPIDPTTGKLRCFVSDALACQRGVRQRPEDAAVIQIPKLSSFRLPLAFVLHREEAQLSAALNSSIRIMRVSTYMEYLKEKYDRTVSGCVEWDHQLSWG